MSKRILPKFVERFKGILNLKFLKKNYTLEKRNNDRIYYKDITDLHDQESDTGTGDRLSRVAEGTAHKTGQLWGTTFRFYNVLKYIKSSNMTILDLGCADAFVRKMVHSGTYWSGTNYIGVDIKYSSLKKASDKMPKCSNQAIFICDDLHGGMKFMKDNSVDLCVAMEVIEHIEEKEGINLLNEIKRVLKPGGLSFISQPNYDPSQWYVMRKWRETGYPQHHCERTWKEFRKLCKSIGFIIVDQYGNLAQRRRLLKAIADNKEMLGVYNRLVSIMGPEVPTQIIGQMFFDSCGGFITVIRKEG